MPRAPGLTGYVRNKRLPKPPAKPSVPGSAKRMTPQEQRVRSSPSLKFDMAARRKKSPGNTRP